MNQYAENRGMSQTAWNKKLKERRTDTDQRILQEDYFYSLVHKTQPVKSVTCLKCRVKFLSKTKGRRICGMCNEVNARQGANAPIFNHFQLEQRD